MTIFSFAFHNFMNGSQLVKKKNSSSRSSSLLFNNIHNSKFHFKRAFLTREPNKKSQKLPPLIKMLIKHGVVPQGVAVSSCVRSILMRISTRRNLKAI